MAKLSYWLRAAAGPLAAGAVGALTVLIVYAAVRGTRGAVFQWAEDNQGTLSLVALIVALVFALVENHRANNAPSLAKSEYIDTILEVLDNTVANTEHLERFLREDDRNTFLVQEVIESFNRAIDDNRETIRLLRPSAPPDGPLALHLSKLEELHQYLCDYDPVKYRNTLASAPRIAAIADACQALELRVMVLKVMRRQIEDRKPSASRARTWST